MPSHRRRRCLERSLQKNRRGCSYFRNHLRTIHDHRCPNWLMPAMRLLLQNLLRTSPRDTIGFLRYSLYARKPSVLHHSPEPVPDYDEERLVSERTMSTEESRSYLEEMSGEGSATATASLASTSSDTDDRGLYANDSGSMSILSDSSEETVPGIAFADATASRSQTELVQEARMKGYEGEPCGTCGQFTMVRNGSCLKCASCGATSGCS